MRSLPWSVLIAISGLACVAESRGAPVAAERDTLPNGTILVHYTGLQEQTAPLQIDLRIGVTEGDPHLMFGDIRSVEAGGDGTIYVLDYLASEIRAFDSTGRYLRTLTRKGEGPGELKAANGMMLVGDSALWIQDHRQWMMIAVDLNGEELTRFKMPVLSYGYVWSGIIDQRGRFWKEVIVSDEPRQYPPKEGLTEDHARGYLKSYDPRTETADSISIGDLTFRTLIARNSQGGYSYRGVPYTPRRITVVDPAGGFWQVSGTAYRIARLDEQGDTALVIEVAADPIPVTDQDRERASKGVGEESPEQQRLAQQIAGAMPEVKPWITGLVMDDVGRLWAQRTATDGEPATYDVFRADGGYVGTVTLSFTPYFPIRIRHGRVYGAVRDSLDVPSVVRSEPLPAFPN